MAVHCQFTAKGWPAIYELKTSISNTQYVIPIREDVEIPNKG